MGMPLAAVSENGDLLALGQRKIWNRFTSQVESLDTISPQPFVDLSIVSELDVVEQDRAVAEKYGAYFRSLLTPGAQIASAQVTAEARQVLGF
jgi:hypothetical protein